MVASFHAQDPNNYLLFMKCVWNLQTRLAKGLRAGISISLQPPLATS